jgi:hypothetical protein
MIQQLELNRQHKDDPTTRTEYATSKLLKQMYSFSVIKAWQ